MCGAGFSGDPTALAISAGATIIGFVRLDAGDEPRAARGVSRIIVFGGYGTFGAIVSRALAALGHAVTVAGRDRGRAEALARTLGDGHSALAADASDRDSCRRALEGHSVAVCCAGPFSGLGDALLAACVESAVHYVDIADDRAYVARGRGWDARFRAAGRAAVFGCSSLPGLSSALALRARAAYDDPPRAARATLFIGNRNPKGAAAVQSMAQALGRAVEAPQGRLTVFGDAERVRLPPPFGERVVRTIDTPDYDLLPALLGAAEVRVKVGFELGLTNRLFAVLASLGVRPGPCRRDAARAGGRAPARVRHLRRRGAVRALLGGRPHEPGRGRLGVGWAAHGGAAVRDGGPRAGRRPKRCRRRSLAARGDRRGSRS